MVLEVNGVGFTGSELCFCFRGDLVGDEEVIFGCGYYVVEYDFQFLGIDI